MLPRPHPENQNRTIHTKMTQLKSNVDGHPSAAGTPASILDTIVQAIDAHDKELLQINKKVLFSF
jgi:hypothetical protein